MTLEPKKCLNILFDCHFSQTKMVCAPFFEGVLFRQWLKRDGLCARQSFVLQPICEVTCSTYELGGQVLGLFFFGGLSLLEM